MKTFHLKADACFRADDIDDALARLGRHFAHAMDDDEATFFLPGSSVDIGPDEPGGDKWGEITCES